MLWTRQVPELHEPRNKKEDYVMASASSKVTTNHKEIQTWVEERGGSPARVNFSKSLKKTSSLSSIRTKPRTAKKAGFPNSSCEILLWRNLARQVIETKNTFRPARNWMVVGRKTGKKHKLHKLIGRPTFLLTQFSSLYSHLDKF